jgi:HEAT repeat protein
MIHEILAKLQEGATPSAVQVSRLSDLSSESLAELRQGWLDVPVDRRRTILGVALQLTEDDVELDFTAFYKACIADSDAAVRALAIEGLGENEEFRTADTLAAMLRADPDGGVRAAAALGLARFAVQAELGSLYAPAAARLRAALLAALTDRDELLDVRRRALEALGALSDPGIRELIDEGYADPNPKMRASAIYAMGRNADKRWLPIVLRELENANPELRFEAARAAGEFENSRAVVPLITLLDDPDVEVRLAAIGALTEIGGDIARKALERCAKSEDSGVRAAAVEALGQLDLGSEPLSISPFLNDSTRTI